MSHWPKSPFDNFLIIKDRKFGNIGNTDSLQHGSSILQGLKNALDR